MIVLTVMAVQTKASFFSFCCEGGHFPPALYNDRNAFYKDFFLSS